MNNTLKRTISVFMSIAIIFSFSACNKGGKKIDAKPANFDEYLNQKFIEGVKSDSISLHFSLVNPEKQGIKDFKPTMGEIKKEDAKKDVAKAKKELDELLKYDYKALTQSQKQDYDVLKYALETDVKYAEFAYYGEPIAPLLGIQSQLPTLLPEYAFRVEKDISDYILLVKDVERYFDDIIEYEKSKSKAGLFMSDAIAQKVIDECNELVKNVDKTALVTVFDKKVDSFKDLSAEKREKYKKENLQAVEVFKKAYSKLSKELTNLKGTGKNDKGLAGLKNGKEYYEVLVRDNVGSEKTVTQLKKSIEEKLLSQIIAMQKITQKDDKVFDRMKTAKPSVTEPAKMIELLKSQIKDFVPELEHVDYELKKVEKEMQDTTSPAFYIIPPIDEPSKNVIYVNDKTTNTPIGTFSTLAHEGYPGHLYQNNYFSQKSPSKIRRVLNFSGYTEGWANYIEGYSYFMADLNDNNLEELLSIDNTLGLLLSARADIGVNYEGWGKPELKKYLEAYGMGEDAVVSSVFSSVIENPANYLSYQCGSLEIEELQRKAEKSLGKKYNIKEFNRAILDVGPAPFKMVAESVDKYIDANS
ncbi:MAG: DUF885 domain-containing protein [Oscillospiraceae bacterium]